MAGSMNLHSYALLVEFRLGEVTEQKTQARDTARFNKVSIDTGLGYCMQKRPG